MPRKRQPKPAKAVITAVPVFREKPDLDKLVQALLWELDNTTQPAKDEDAGTPPAAA